MALRHTPYAPQTSLTLAELDDTFADVAAIGVVPCTATGTNAITLTPNANTPTISAYANYLRFSFTALNTSTGAVTVQIGSLALLPLYTADGTTQIGSGGIVASAFYDIVFIQALNAGVGGFVIANASVTATTPGTYNKVVVDSSGRVTSGTTGVAIQQVVFPSTATFSTASGTGVSTVYEITLVGPGGGGGGAAGVAQSAGGGGGGGAVCMTWLSGVAANTAVVFTIGSGGLGGANTFSGVSGASTSVTFSAVNLLAPGGTGGAVAAQNANVGGGLGGVASGGMNNLTGQGGGIGIAGAAAIVVAGYGGSSALGGGASQSGSTGIAGGNYGGGGSGACNNNAGGNGADGRAWIKWIQ